MTNSLFQDNQSEPVPDLSKKFVPLSDTTFSVITIY